MSQSAAIKLVRRVREIGSVAPAHIGDHRKPFLVGHVDLLQELTTTRGHVTPAEIQAALTAHGIEAAA